MSIEVDVTLFPPLRENRFSRSAVSLTEAATVRGLLDTLSIDDQEIESIYVNGKEAGFDQRLKTGDRVTFLPFIGGG